MQRGKPLLDMSTFNYSDIDSLGEKVLDMPLKKSKQIKEILKLRAQEHKILKQMNSKPTKPTPKNSTINRSKSVPALQHEFQNNYGNSSYIVNCIIRSLRFRKLAIDDIAQIFCIQPQVVEEIDKFRRLKQFQSGQDLKNNPKLQMKKNKMLQRFQNNIKNFTMQKVVESNFNNIPSKIKKNNHSQSRSTDKSPFSFNHLSQSKAINNQSYRNNPMNGQLMRNPEPTPYASSHIYSDLNQLTSYLDQPQQNSEGDLFEYQRLLRNKPPHRLDNKTIAIVDILKKRPNLMQKDIIKVLAEDYAITGITQTSISRYIKRIYDMKKYVDIILQAQKEGFIVL